MKSSLNKVRPKIRTKIRIVKTLAELYEEIIDEMDKGIAKVLDEIVDKTCQEVLNAHNDVGLVRRILWKYYKPSCYSKCTKAQHNRDGK